jgi:hypothetical protein
VTLGCAVRTTTAMPINIRASTPPQNIQPTLRNPARDPFGEKGAAGRIIGTCLPPYRRHRRGPARPRERPAIRQC